MRYYSIIHTNFVIYIYIYIYWNIIQLISFSHNSIKIVLINILKYTDKRLTKTKNYWRKPTQGYLRHIEASPKLELITPGLRFFFVGEEVPRFGRGWQSSDSILLRRRVALPPCFRYPVPPPIFMRAGELGWFHGIWKVSGPRTEDESSKWGGRERLWRAGERSGDTSSHPVGRAENHDASFVSASRFFRKLRRRSRGMNDARVRRKSAR